MKQVTMESVKQRIADLESTGKVVGGLSLSSEFELACLRELVAVTERAGELNKALDVSLRVQVDQANRISQMLDEIKRAESAIGSLGWMSLDTAISLELSKLNKQISDLQEQVRLLTEQRDALVAENAVLIDLARKFADRADDYKGSLMGFSVFESFNELKIAGSKEATSSAIAALRAEGVRPRIQERDLKALLRFNETCEDGEGYDIGIDAMNRLVEIGLCGKGYGGIRHITPFGQWVIDAQEGEIDSTPLRTESDVNADFSEHLARQLRESKGEVSNG